MKRKQKNLWMNFGKMNDREIIEGLMLMLEDEDINVTKLAKRIGYKNYKKFEDALHAAFKIIENE